MVIKGRVLQCLGQSGPLRAISAALAIVALGSVLLPPNIVFAAEERITLAVIDLQDKGAGSELCKSLTDVLAVTLERVGVFRVLSRADMRQMIEFEADKQFVGCESNSSCLAEIGGALGVALLVNGSLGKVGSSYIINLTLTDTKNAKVLAREQRQVGKVEELPKALTGAGRFLVRSLLASRQGSLVIQSPELGADVEIDGRIIGVTPLLRQELPSGPHTVKVIKKGFVTWARDIDVKTEQPALVEVLMVPSLEYISEYDNRSSAWRLWSYISGGLGVAGVGFGAYGYFVYNAGRARAFKAELEVDGCATAGILTPQIADCNAKYAVRRQAIESFDTISIVSGWVGLAAFGVGTYLFFQGPRPGLYDAYKKGDDGAKNSQTDSNVQVGIDVIPTPGGAFGRLSLSF